MPGLSVSDVVKVSINLAPLAVPVRNFGAVCIAGPSTVIDTKERLRLYTSIDGIAADFGSSAPEYLAGLAFFSQAPRPAFCYVGRFAQTAASAILHGGRMTAAQQAIAASHPGQRHRRHLQDQHRRHPAHRRRLARDLALAPVRRHRADLAGDRAAGHHRRRLQDHRRWHRLRHRRARLLDHRRPRRRRHPGRHRAGAQRRELRVGPGVGAVHRQVRHHRGIASS
jgi:hypothetical protein